MGRFHLWIQKHGALGIVFPVKSEIPLVTGITSLFLEGALGSGCLQTSQVLGAKVGACASASSAVRCRRPLSSPFLSVPRRLRVTALCGLVCVTRGLSLLKFGCTRSPTSLG